MAATAWIVYNKAINKLNTGAMSLSGAFRMVLVGSAGNYATSTMSLLGSVTDQVTSGNGYSSSGKALVSEGFPVGTSAGQYKLSAAALTWTATGGAINSIKAAIIYASGASAGACHLLCWSQLTTAAFNLASGNTLTITPTATGIFTVNNA